MRDRGSQTNKCRPQSLLNICFVFNPFEIQAAACYHESPPGHLPTPAALGKTTQSPLSTWRPVVPPTFTAQDPVTFYRGNKRASERLDELGGYWSLETQSSAMIFVYLCLFGGAGGVNLTLFFQEQWLCRHICTLELDLCYIDSCITL